MICESNSSHTLSNSLPYCIGCNSDTTKVTTDDNLWKDVRKSGQSVPNWPKKVPNCHIFFAQSSQDKYVTGLHWWCLYAKYDVLVSVYEISCSLQQRLRAMPYFYDIHRNSWVKGWTATMWCGRPMDHSHRAIEEMMGYTERSENSSTSINLNFRRSLYWLSQSDYWSSAGPNFYWLKVLGVKNDFAYRRCGGVSRMQVIYSPEVNKKHLQSSSVWKDADGLKFG